MLRMGSGEIETRIIDKDSGNPGHRMFQKP